MEKTREEYSTPEVEIWEFEQVLMEVSAGSGTGGGFNGGGDDLDDDL